MKKVNQDFSKSLKQSTPVMSDSQKSNTVTLENPADAKKLSIIKGKFAAFIRENGKTPPENFIADEKAYTFDEDGDVYTYVLSKMKPAMGIFGNLTSEEVPKIWVLNKAKDSVQVDAIKSKEVKLLKVFNKAKIAAKTSYDEAAAEDVNVDMTEPVDQSDTESSKEPK